MRLSNKVVGSILILAILGLAIVSWVFNMFDFIAHLGEVYAIVIAELLVALPLVVVWMFNQEIKDWVYLQNMPHLIVEKVKLESGMLIQQICVQPHNGDPLCRKVNAVFVSVKNTKGRIAREVVVETNLGGYNTDMVLITPTGTNTLTVPSPSFISDEAVEKDDPSFVSAVLNDVDRERFVLRTMGELVPFPKGRDKKFVLCFTMEGSDTSQRMNRVWIPHKTKIWEFMPCDFPLFLKFYSQGVLVGTGAFRISGDDWKTLAVEPILDSDD
jgi:hypothetical protein